MKVKITIPDKAFENAFGSMERTIARASKSAVIEMAKNLKQQGRANIIAGGLGKRVANAYRVDTYPTRRDSINAAALAYSKAGFLDVFERGDTIRGNPLLWVPLASTPQKIGRQRMSPKLYNERIGPLVSIVRPGKPPLLAGQISTNRRGQKRKGKVTLSALRRGNSGQASQLVPLFIGLPSIKEKDRLSLRSIANANAAKLPALFFAKLDRGN
jgi:hypothetical protein